MLKNFANIIILEINPQNFRYYFLHFKTEKSQIINKQINKEINNNNDEFIKILLAIYSQRMKLKTSREIYKIFSKLSNLVKNWEKYMKKLYKILKY